MQRIALWILIGAAVTCFWVLFGMLAFPHYNISHWTVVAITVPASILLPRSRPITYYEVMLANAIIYGLVGLALEPLFRLRRRFPAPPAPTR